MNAEPSPSFDDLAAALNALGRGEADAVVRVYSMSAILRLHAL